MEKPDLSVIIPVKDEFENISVLINEIIASFEKYCWTYEIIIVDDGSEDGTSKLVKEISENNAKVRSFHLKINCGKSAALWCGFQHSEGRYLATLDGDCQNDPRDIPRLFEIIQGGHVDFVHGMRSNRKDSLVRKISSKMANKTRNLVLGHLVNDSGCAVHVFNRECMNNVPIFEGMHRFLPTLVKNNGYSIEEVPINHRERTKGKAKYGIRNRLFCQATIIFPPQRQLFFPVCSSIKLKEKHLDF